jgi:hypothetical protein
MQTHRQWRLSNRRAGPINPPPTPLPSSASLLLTGAAVLGLLLRRRGKGDGRDDQSRATAQDIVSDMKAIRAPHSILPMRFG